MIEEKIILPVTGMTCANCAMNIERSLKKMAGVHEVAVNFATEQATVHMDGKRLRIGEVIQNIEKSGYSVPTYGPKFQSPE